MGLQGVLSLAFMGAGTMKVITPYAELTQDPSMGWALDFSEGAIMAIGATEFIFALGLGLSFFVGSLQKWTSVFAVGLACVMMGAAYTHIGRGEPFTPNIVLFLMGAVVAFAHKDRLKSA